MLRVVMLRVVMLRVVVLRVILLSVIMLNVVMLNDVIDMLNADMLSIMAPNFGQDQRPSGRTPASPSQGRGFECSHFCCLRW